MHELRDRQVIWPPRIPRDAGNLSGTYEFAKNWVEDANDRSVTGENYSLWRTHSLQRQNQNDGQHCAKLKLSTWRDL